MTCDNCDNSLASTWFKCFDSVPSNAFWAKALLQGRVLPGTRRDLRSEESCLSKTSQHVSAFLFDLIFVILFNLFQSAKMGMLREQGPSHWDCHVGCTNLAPRHICPLTWAWHTPHCHNNFAKTGRATAQLPIWGARRPRLGIAVCCPLWAPELSHVDHVTFNVPSLWAYMHIQRLISPGLFGKECHRQSWLRSWIRFAGCQD